MLNPTPPSEVLPQRNTIQIPVTEVLPGVQPIISVGEVLRMLVRSNDQGQGQLYYRGMLIAAQLPDTLAAGDKILAKVTDAGTQLVLKLLDAQKGTTPGPKTEAASGQVQAQLAEEFEAILRDAANPALRLSNPVTLPQVMSSVPLPQVSKTDVPAQQGATAAAQKPAEEITVALQKLFASLVSSDQLKDPQIALTKLLDTTAGKVAVSLRTAAEQISKLVDEPYQTSAGRFLEALQDELGKLLDDVTHDNKSSSKQLTILVNALTAELKSGKKAPENEQRLLQATLEDLTAAQNSPEQLAQKLETSLNRLNDPGRAVAQKFLALDPQMKNELKEITNRLEQLANSQETLNRLNPVMQALGEPALILFPFLAQGLLSHSQVTIESPIDRENGNGGERRDYDQGEEGEADSAPYQRIQVNVPLPAMGQVHVDIAHRKEEILVRFSVGNPEASAFLLEQLEHLAVTLKGLNFSRTELMTHVGTRPDDPPQWTVNASAISNTVV